MKKLKNSMMLVVAALSGYLALMTPDWKSDLVAAMNPGYGSDYTGNGVAGWIWLGRFNGLTGTQRTWAPDWPNSTQNWITPDRTFPPDWAQAGDYDIATVGDFNGDGTTDWLWRATAAADGRWKVWQMVNGTRGGQNNPPNFDANHDYVVHGAGDTDGDGDDDVIMENTTTDEFQIWEMQNYAVANTHVVGTRAGFDVAAVGDFDADGDADLLLQATGGTTLRFWEIQNNAFVQELTTPHTGSGYNPACAGDFNGDGNTDLYLIAGNGATKFFEYSNFTRVTQYFTANQAAFNLHACEDFDADGTHDLLWSSSDGEGYNRVTTQTNFASKRTYYTNRFGGTTGNANGYGFEHRASGN